MEKSLTYDQDDNPPTLAATNGRSFGLRAFDAFLYPGVANIGVFVTSVFFTYLTNRGSHVGKPGTFARQAGNFFEQRGEWVKKGLMHAGMPEGAANTAKMVFWSFADGSLTMPAVKYFEDSREDIARRIDHWFGTEPDDPSVYSAEPKQSWASVLGGRALTAGIVVPTAVALEKTKLGKKNLNQILFYDLGENLGNNLVQHPRLVKRFGKEAIHEMSKVTFFEAFYTSVCTAGLYYTSRIFASWGDKKHEATKATERSDAPQAGDFDANLADQSLRLKRLIKQPEGKNDAPDTKVEAARAHETVHAPEAVALAAQ